VPDHNSTKFFGKKFWQHGDVSAQRFISKGTTVAMGGCHHLSIANVTRISVALF
jgi:CO dehydrogenase/acetyl-CoA synthase delta subunit